MVTPNPVVRTLDIGVDGVSIADGVEAVALQAKRRLRVLLGEWYADIYEGVPYELVFSRRLTLGQVSAILVDELRKIRHVTQVSVRSASIEPMDRVHTFHVTLQTDFGASTTLEVVT